MFKTKDSITGMNKTDLRTRVLLGKSLSRLTIEKTYYYTVDFGESIEVSILELSTESNSWRLPNS